MTKPIIVVKMPNCKLLHISKKIFLALHDIKAYNRSYNAASDWPHTFLQPGYFRSGVKLVLHGQIAILVLDITL